MSGDALLLFTRYPLAHQVKTRLIPNIGVEQATRLHKRLSEQTAQTLRLAAEQMERTTVFVCYTGAEEARMRQWLGGDLNYLSQCGGDLGRRMLDGFRQVLAAGYARAVLVGSDCPGLTSNLLQQAMGALQEHDLVLGEAWDGGYYLIGLRQAQPEIFRDIAWSTPRVLAETLDRCGEYDISVHLLAKLRDVDTAADLAHFPELLARP